MAEPENDSSALGFPGKSSPPRDSKGWDGKLRLDKNKEPIIPEAPTPPDTDEEDAPERQVEEVPGGEIDADEGETYHIFQM